MTREIKYTPRGFSYVDVSLKECLNWGGLGICDGCGTGPHKELKLIWVLHDTYCPKCFKEWVERQKEYSDEDVLHDLILQKEHDKQYYEAYSKYFLGEWNNEKN